MCCPTIWRRMMGWRKTLVKKGKETKEITNNNSLNNPTPFTHNTTHIPPPPTINPSEELLDFPRAPLGLVSLLLEGDKTNKMELVEEQEGRERREELLGIHPPGFLGMLILLGFRRWMDQGLGRGVEEEVEGLWEGLRERAI